MKYFYNSATALALIIYQLSEETSVFYSGIGETNPYSGVVTYEPFCGKVTEELRI